MEDNKRAKNLDLAIGAVFIIAAGLLAFLAAERQGGVAAPVPAAGPLETPATAAPTDVYNSLANLKSLKLAENFESWTPEAQVAADKTIAKKLEVQGNVARAYLLVRASEGSNGLTRWDSFYFKIDDAGGHLFRPMTLPVPQNGTGTTLLYDLRSLPVLKIVPYDESRVPETADLTSVLRDGRVVGVTAFISSLRPGAIDELTLYYGCVEGDDCRVEAK